MRLNNYQQRVVDHDAGQAVVFAAAGSGKTTCMVRRAVRLVDSGVNPTSIQILVYNRSAADVVRARLSAIGSRYAGINVNTFHSLGNKLCRELVPEAIEGKLVLDTEGAPRQIGLVFEAMRDANIQEGEWKEWMARADLARELLIPPEEVAANYGRLFVPQEMAASLAAFCHSYAEIKDRRNVIDFNDMLWQLACSVGLGTDNRLYGRCKHLIIDEAQDATPLRWFIADGMAFADGVCPDDGSIDSYMAVGDPCQSIYAYQGADPDIFLSRSMTNFAGRDPWQSYTLPVNFRSGSTIIDLGNRIVDNRSWKIADAIPRDDAGGGEIQSLATVADVVAHISRSISSDWSLEGGHEGSTVILARTNAELAAYEVSLIVNRIPCRTRNTSGSIWESQYGMLFMSYLQLCNGGQEDWSAGWELLESIFTRPNRFIRKEALRQAFDGSIQSLIDSGVNNIAEFGRLLDYVRRCIRTDKFGRAVDAVAGQLVQDVKKRAGNSLGSADEDKIGLIGVLQSAATQAGSIDGILDMVDSVFDSASTPHVLLSTIHKSKGGEWKRVYADVNWVKAAIARSRQSVRIDNLQPPAAVALMAGNLSDNDARLLYVETTRAIDELYLVGV